MEMISLSDKAVLEINRIIAEQKLENISLRIGVRGGGCSGLNYTLGFDDKEPNEIDMIFEQDGIHIVIDPKSFLYLAGVKIDFETDLMGRGFKFINPNATGGTCGCGQSFGV